MSAMAASAAAFARPVPSRSSRPGRSRSGRRVIRGRSIGIPGPVWVAWCALLDVAGLDEASDVVRLAVLVLASWTPAETGVVEIRTGELGRWLGLSASHVASNG
ncbi:hypothetical protein ACFCXT_38520 [Streptomyces vinaceus]|uniref:hypothetical protein n=1 Tax=Streptomyces vinaceus TaxID=1960 RepID=UPI0035DC50A3